MNAQLRSPEPLTFALPPSHPVSRRRRVGGIELDEVAIAQFNRLLRDIAGTDTQVSADQLVTLARWLKLQPRSDGIALLAERVARADYLRRMLADGDWELSAELRDRARLLVDYLSRADDLIPDDMPVFGYLDDALLIELSWSAFAGEAQDYRDFCRFRVEQRPRGTPAERRLAWENSVLAKANDMVQRRRVNEHHYASVELHQALFRVC